MASHPPGYLLATAVSMRLVDLYDSGLAPNASVITVPVGNESGALHLAIADAVLSTLEALSHDAHSPYLPMETVCREVKARVPAADPDRIRFVCRFLGMEREIQYFDETDDHTLATRVWTRLVEYDARRDLVRLREAGNLFGQLANTSRSWLYEEQQAARILHALKIREFRDCLTFAEDHVRALRRLSDELARLMQQPSPDAAAAGYVERRTAIGEMLHRTIETLRQAVREVDQPGTLNALQAILEHNPDYPVSRGLLLRGLDRAHQAAESANRLWVRFLDYIQADHRQPLGLLDFGLILEKAAHRLPSDPALKHLEQGCFGWIPHLSLASGSDLVGCLEVEALREPPPPLEFVLDPDAPLTEEADSWSEFHREQIIRSLEHGPRAFSDLVGDAVLAAGAMETASDVAAAFAILTTQDGLGEHVALSIEATGERTRGQREQWVWEADDFVVTLADRAPRP